MGKDIMNVFPRLTNRLDTQSMVAVCAPNPPKRLLRASPARTQGKTFKWFVRFDQLDAQPSEVLKAATVERKFLAAEVHAGPSQVLTALMLVLGQLDAGASKEELVEVRALVDQLALSLDTITVALAPPRAAGGLGYRVRALADVLERHLGLQVSAPDSHHGLYSEVVENAAIGGLEALLLHAWQASHLDAAISLHESKLEVRIVVELSKFTGDLSLAEQCIMSERFRDADGQVLAEMEGTTATIALRFPLEKRSAEVCS